MAYKPKKEQDLAWVSLHGRDGILATKLAYVRGAGVGSIERGFCTVFGKILTDKMQD